MANTITKKIIFETIVKNAKAFKQNLVAPMEEFRRTMGGPGGMDKRFKANKTTMGRFANTMRLVTHGMKGFRMEMLGVMFFGMMMQKVLFGMAKPAAELFGWFDMMRLTLMIFFIPTIQSLNEKFYELTNNFINLDDSTKKLWGDLIILAGMGAFVLMVIGQMGLGIGSLIQLLNALGPIFTGIRTIFLSAFTGLGSIFALIIIGMVLAWKENFAGMKSWTRSLVKDIGSIFKSLWKVISGIFDIFNSIIQGDFEATIEAIKKIWTGLKEFVAGIALSIIDIIVMLGIGVFRIFSAFVGWLVNVWSWLIRQLNKMTDGWLESTRDGIVKLLRLLERAAFRLGFSDLGGGIGSIRQALESFEFNPTAPIVGQNPFAETFQATKGGVQQSISITNNINVVDQTDLERLLDEKNKEVIEELNRYVQPQGGS